MNANIDQLTVQGSAIDPLTKPSANHADYSPVPFPEGRKTWFQSYDEEWATFLAESSIKKSRPGINNDLPEALPRVWNTPV